MEEIGDPRPGALRIDSVAVPGGGLIGMTHLPGRCHRDAAGGVWRRGLAADLAAIEAWGARLVVTLVEDREFEVYGVADFAVAIRSRRFGWFHLPIADMRIPDRAFAAAWDRRGTELIARLKAGERILLHCAGGFGRTGMLAARLLVEFGIAPPDAIAAVRAARPGTIETAAQEGFVLSRAALGSPAQRIGGE